MSDRGPATPKQSDQIARAPIWADLARAQVKELRQYTGGVRMAFEQSRTPKRKNELGARLLEAEELQHELMICAEIFESWAEDPPPNIPIPEQLHMKHRWLLAEERGKRLLATRN